METVANITLGIGIIAVVIIVGFVCFKDPTDPYSDEIKINPTGIVMACGTLLLSLASYASMKVLANISRSLKDIKNKLTSH